MTVKELKIELKNTKKAKKDYQENQKKIWKRYFEMEGMYGTKVPHEVWDMHDRGYHYKYSSKEVEEKENTDRKQFLIDNNANEIYEWNTPFDDKIKELENQICIAENGYDLEMKNLLSKKKRYTKTIEELKIEVMKYENLLKEVEEQILKKG